MPDHDYDDVPIEGEEGGIHQGPQLTPPMDAGQQGPQLTPPVDATYSIVGDGPEYEYSHLDRADSRRSRDGESDEGHLTSPELRSPATSDAGYSAITGSISPAAHRTRRGSERSYTSGHGEGSFKMQPRPQTSYESLHLGRENVPFTQDRALPSTGGCADEGGQVSRAKLNLIMDQLRKIQKEKEQLQMKNSSLSQQIKEMQQQVCVFVCVRVFVCGMGSTLLLTAQQTHRRELPVA